MQVPRVPFITSQFRLEAAASPRPRPRGCSRVPRCWAGGWAGLWSAYLPWPPKGRASPLALAAASRWHIFQRRNLCSTVISVIVSQRRDRQFGASQKGVLGARLVTRRDFGNIFGRGRSRSISRLQREAAAESLPKLPNLTESGLLLPPDRRYLRYQPAYNNKRTILQPTLCAVRGYPARLLPSWTGARTTQSPVRAAERRSLFLWPHTECWSTPRS